jgi:hypothetical protein
MIRQLSYKNLPRNKYYGLVAVGHVPTIVGVEVVNDGIGVCHLCNKDGVRYPTGKHI